MTMQNSKMNAKNTQRTYEPRQQQALQVAKTSNKIHDSEKGQDSIGVQLIKMTPQLAKVLPSHMSAERVIRMVQTELRNNKDLEKSEPASLLGAVMMCAQLGLEPGATFGHAYIVKIGSKANLWIGYKGMLELARRSGEIKRIAAAPVYANDKFKYTLGSDPKIEHEPTLGERGFVTHYYAIADFTSGGSQFHVMRKAEIDAVKKDSDIWRKHYDEMAKKTVIRRLFKYLPISLEKIQLAVSIDEAAEANVQSPETYYNYEAHQVLDAANAEARNNKDAMLSAESEYEASFSSTCGTYECTPVQQSDAVISRMR